mgnify:CR=1 FL=1
MEQALVKHKLTSIQLQKKNKKNTSKYGLNLNKHKYSSLKDNLCKEEKATFKTSHVRGRM